MSLLSKQMIDRLIHFTIQWKVEHR